MNDDVKSRMRELRPYGSVRGRGSISKEKDPAYSTKVYSPTSREIIPLRKSSSLPFHIERQSQYFAIRSVTQIINFMVRNRKNITTTRSFSKTIEAFVFENEVVLIFYPILSEAVQHNFH